MQGQLGFDMGQPARPHRAFPHPVSHFNSNTEGHMEGHMLKLKRKQAKSKSSISYFIFKR